MKIYKIAGSMHNGTWVGLGIEHTYEVFGDFPGEVIKII